MGSTLYKSIGLLFPAVRLPVSSTNMNELFN